MKPYEIKCTGKLAKVLDGNVVLYNGTLNGAMNFVDTHQVVGQVQGVPVTRSELSECFNQVANSDNWKNPINAILPCEDTSLNRDLYAKAIEFFTGSIAEFTVDDKGTWIKAKGYYAVCGA